MRVRAGVVGLGKMGLLHAGLLSALPDVALVAVCERQFLIRRFAHKMLPGVTVVRDLSELGGLRLDAVYVTTLPGSHFPLVRYLLERGITKNVFVEKPLAASAREAAELCRMARRTGGLNMVGFQKRFAVTFRKAKEILSQGRLGDIVLFDAYAYSSDFSQGRKGRRAPARGGVLRDLGCHVLDLVLWFFGSVDVASATCTNLGSRAPGESVSVRLTTPRGIVGTLSASATMPDYRLPEFGLTVTGRRGRMRVNDDRVEVTLDSANPVVWHRQALDDRTPFLLADPEYAREDEAFVQGITTGSRVSPSFEDGLKVEALIDRIHASVFPHADRR